MTFVLPSAYQKEKKNKSINKQTKKLATKKYQKHISLINLKILHKIVKSVLANSWRPLD